ncbi:SRPBCC family protein [Flindersiella endophytica]
MSDYTVRARIAAPPASVRSALTDPAALRTWLAEHAEVSLADGQFEFWGRYTPQGQPGRQRLRAVGADRLCFAWTLDEVETRVELYWSADESDGTLLTLTQSGLPTLDELMAPPGRRNGLHTMHTFWSLALANLAAHLEGRDLMPLCDFSSDRAREIRFELRIDSSPEEVFAALADPDQIERWFGWRVELEPTVGGRTTFGIDGRIFEFEPGRRLAYGDEHGAVVRWELTGSDGSTHLSFVQSGFGADELDDAAQHEAGWLGGVAELKRMYELGAAYQPLIVESELPQAGDTTVTYQVRLDAPPEEVFEALTEEHALSIWLAEQAEVSLVDGQFEFWGRFTPEGEPGRQRLIEAVPGRLLRFAWLLDGVETTVEIGLKPAGPERTVATVTHSGCVPYQEVLAGKSQSVRGVMHTFWALSMANLADYVIGRKLTPMCDYTDDLDPDRYADVLVDAELDAVYASIADEDRFADWFGARPSDIVLDGSAGVVAEPRPGEEITFSWGGAGMVRWELSGTEGKTSLTFVQSGFDRPADVSGWAGWLSGVAELRRMHELGDAWQPITAVDLTEKG